MVNMVFKVEKIINMVIEIEKRTRKYYRDTAAEVSDPHVRAVFEMLAGMEGEHVIRFQQIRSHLSEREKSTEIKDPGAEMHFYLEKFKEIQATELQNGKDNSVSENTSEIEIIKNALIAEKETIAFYRFLYNYLPAENGLGKMLAIVQEERQHMELLNKLLIKMEQVDDFPAQKVSEYGFTLHLSDS